MEAIIAPFVECFLVPGMVVTHARAHTFTHTVALSCSWFSINNLRIMIIIVIVIAAAAPLPESQRYYRDKKTVSACLSQDLPHLPAGFALAIGTVSHAVSFPLKTSPKGQSKHQLSFSLANTLQS